MAERKKSENVLFCEDEKFPLDRYKNISRDAGMNVKGCYTIGYAKPLEPFAMIIIGLNIQGSSISRNPCDLLKELDEPKFTGKIVLLLKVDSKENPILKELQQNTRFTAIFYDDIRSNEFRDQIKKIF